MTVFYYFLALDAYCLIEVYDVILRLCNERCLPLYEIIQTIMNSGPPKNKGKKNKPKVHFIFLFSIFEVIIEVY